MSNNMNTTDNSININIQIGNLQINNNNNYVGYGNGNSNNSNNNARNIKLIQCRRTLHIYRSEIRTSINIPEIR